MRKIVLAVLTVGMFVTACKADNQAAVSRSSTVKKQQAVADTVNDSSNKNIQKDNEINDAVVSKQAHNNSAEKNNKDGSSKGEELFDNSADSNEDATQEKPSSEVKENESVDVSEVDCHQEQSKIYWQKQCLNLASLDSEQLCLAKQGLWLVQASLCKRADQVDASTCMSSALHLWNSDSCQLLEKVIEEGCHTNPQAFWNGKNCQKLSTLNQFESCRLRQFFWNAQDAKCQKYASYAANECELTADFAWLAATCQPLALIDEATCLQASDLYWEQGRCQKIENLASAACREFGFYWAGTACKKYMSLTEQECSVYDRSLWKDNSCVLVEKLSAEDCLKDIALYTDSQGICKKISTVSNESSCLAEGLYFVNNKCLRKEQLSQAQCNAQPQLFWKLKATLTPGCESLSSITSSLHCDVQNLTWLDGNPGQCMKPANLSALQCNRELSKHWINNYCMELVNVTTNTTCASDPTGLYWVESTKTCKKLSSVVTEEDCKNLSSPTLTYAWIASEGACRRQ